MSTNHHRRYAELQFSQKQQWELGACLQRKMSRNSLWPQNTRDILEGPRVIDFDYKVLRIVTRTLKI